MEKTTRFNRCYSIFMMSQSKNKKHALFKQSRISFTREYVLLGWNWLTGSSWCSSMYVCHFSPLKTEMILRLKKHEFFLSDDALEQNFNTECVVFFLQFRFYLPLDLDVNLPWKQLEFPSPMTASSKALWFLRMIWNVTCKR